MRMRNNEEESGTMSMDAYVNKVMNRSGKKEVDNFDNLTELHKVKSGMGRSTTVLCQCPRVTAEYRC